MSDNFLDHLPSALREKIRKRLRSPEEYEKLRERVKGPEDLERELKRAERIADASFRLETDPGLKESLKNTIAEDLRERGLEEILDQEELSEDVVSALEKGAFDLRVDAHPETHEDTLVLLPEGNVADKIPVRPNLSEQYLTSLPGPPQNDGK